ncbi:MAG: hypothetical protein Q8O03_06555, partial [Nanoarchaeota archaeon]|nr:hypothetical protein [Nanoarchaeota archaeon]
MKTYLEQWFDEIEREVKPENWKQCNALSNAYLGKYIKGAFKGWSKSLTLEDVIKRKEKGEWIVEKEYKRPREEVNDEVKATMDIMQSTFIEYINSAESQIDIWRERHPQKAIRSLYELSMVYMGREFNGEKSPNLESIESRYKRANQVILKHARKDLTIEKLKAIKDLTKRFEEYEKNLTYQEKYRQALRTKNQEAIHTVERFAEY